jgi:hypothetical protein
MSRAGNLGHFIKLLWCLEGDLNPHDRLRSADFKSAVSADFTIQARFKGSPSYRIAGSATL